MASIWGDVSTPTIFSASGKAWTRARVEKPTPQHISSTFAFSLLYLVESSSATYVAVKAFGVVSILEGNNMGNRAESGTYSLSNVDTFVCNIINHLGRDGSNCSMDLWTSITKDANVRRRPLASTPTREASIHLQLPEFPCYQECGFENQPSNALRSIHWAWHCRHPTSCGRSQCVQTRWR